MASKPTNTYRFATDGGVTLEPNEAKKDTGWVNLEKPAHDFFNWLHFGSYEWRNWLNERLFDGANAEEFVIRGRSMASTEGLFVDSTEFHLKSSASASVLNFERVGGAIAAGGSMGVLEGVADDGLSVAPFAQLSIEVPGDGTVTGNTSRPSQFRFRAIADGSFSLTDFLIMRHGATVNDRQLRFGESGTKYIEHDDSGDVFRFRPDGTERLTIDANGIHPDGDANFYLGINGSSNPEIRLEANNVLFFDRSASDLVLQRDGGVCQFSLEGYAGALGNIIEGKRALGSLSTPLTVGGGDQLFELRSHGYDGTSFVNGSRLVFSVDGTVSTGIVPTNMFIQLMTATGNISTNVILSAETNGTTAPLLSLSNTGVQYAPLTIEVGAFNKVRSVAGIDFTAAGAWVTSASGRNCYAGELLNDFISTTGQQAMYLSALPFELAAATAADTADAGWKAFRLLKGTGMANQFWVSANGYGFFRGNVGIGAVPTTSQVARFRDSGSTGEFNFNASTSGSFYEATFFLDNVGFALQTSSVNRPIILTPGGSQVALKAFSSGDIQIGDTNERITQLTFGASFRYGIGIDPTNPRTIVYRHNAGLGLGLGEFNGTTFTYHAYSDTGGKWGFGVGTNPSFNAANTNVTILSINSSHDCLNLTHARNDGLGNILICRRNDNPTSGTLVFQMQSDGDVFNLNGTYATLSDITAKENIEPLPEMLGRVTALEPILYSLTDGDREGDPRKMGFSAQQLQEHFPDLVTRSKEFGNKLTSNNYGLIPALVQSMKDLKALVDSQAHELEDLRKRLN